MPSSRLLPVPAAPGFPARPPVSPPRFARLWVGLSTLTLGLVGGFCLHALVDPPRPNVAYLTPQQHELYQLVQDYSLAATPDQRWKIQAKLDKVARALHPEPRPPAEILLPRGAQP